jgi:hypothetical protein
MSFSRAESLANLVANPTPAGKFQPPERSFGVEEPSLGCRQRDAYRFCRLLHGASLQLNLNDGPECRSQALDGLPHNSLCFALRVTTFGIQSTIAYFIAQAIPSTIIVTFQDNLRRGSLLSEDH